LRGLEPPNTLGPSVETGRSKWYESVEQMQVDLDAYLVNYDTQKPHQGWNMNGRTPIAVFEAGLELVPEVNEEITGQEMAAAQ
jgi:hypothetical protein